jgi:hypothetical protein
VKTIKFLELDNIYIYIYIFLPLVEPIPANGMLLASAILVYPHLSLRRPPRHLRPTGRL